METIKDLLIDELKDLYSAEKQIVKALPKIIRAAQAAELKEALTGHLQVTKDQVGRLEQAFAMAEVKAKAKHCKGMEGLLEEGADGIEENKKGVLLDLLIIGACRRVEHYEVAAYSTAQALAEHAGMPDIAEVLGQTLAEESEADEALTAVANSLYGKVEPEEDSMGTATAKKASGKRSSK